MIGEDRRAFLAADGCPQKVRQAVSVEDVVAEDEARVLPGNEIGADDVGLGEAFRIRLLSIGN